MSPGDRFDLERFVTAQAGGVHERALAELEAGAKRGHWMWFVFPQLRGLGRSPTAERYGITGPAEATAYLAHPVLGPRLVGCCEVLLALGPECTAEAVLGGIDALKLRSCTTLFHRVSARQTEFAGVLERFYAGAEDAATLRLLLDPGSGQGFGVGSPP